MVIIICSDGTSSHVRLSNFDISARNGCTVRQRLRGATAEVHEALHEHPDFVRLLEQRITLPEYRRLLARLFGFHWSLERGLRAASPEVLGGLDVRARERSPALRADLLHLGMSEGEIDALPLCRGLRPAGSHAALLGQLYVIEGSALGGRIMAGRLDRLLGPYGSEGRRFFAGRPAPDPLPWPVFCQLLEARGAGAVQAVTESAEAIFNAMALWLKEGEAHA